MKGYRRYIAIIVFLFGTLVLIDYFRPKPVDWTKSFSNKDKIPYGTYALYELLPDIFKGEPVTPVRLPIFNQLQDSTLTGNYIFINNTFVADSLDLQQLLDFVNRGNKVFIAAEGFSEVFADTLKFHTELLNTTDPDSTALVFTNQSLSDSFTFPANNNSKYLVVGDSTRYLPLGKNKAGKLNFMEVPFGEGSFFISTVPLAFTNYELITLDESEYAAIALSHLPVDPVLWDEYQNQGQLGESSVFRVLLNHEALTWAYYLSLFSVVLFLLFESKRTQRIIPVMEPPRNTTLEFVKVVGSLYHSHGNHKNIAEKKITYFLEFLRMRYHVTTNELDEELRQRVISKSGVDEGLVNKLFNLIGSIRNSSVTGETTLMILNNHLEDFYRQTLNRPVAHQ